MCTIAWSILFWVDWQCSTEGLGVWMSEMAPSLQCKADFITCLMDLLSYPWIYDMLQHSLHPSRYHSTGWSAWCTHNDWWSRYWYHDSNELMLCPNLIQLNFWPFNLISLSSAITGHPLVIWSTLPLNVWDVWCYSRMILLMHAVGILCAIYFQHRHQWTLWDVG